MIRPVRDSILALTLAAAASTSVRRAEACSLRQLPEPYPGFMERTVPSNPILTGTATYVTGSGATVTTQTDTELTALLGQGVSRPLGGVLPPMTTTIEPSGACEAGQPCTQRMQVEPTPDNTPPEAARIGASRTVLVRNASRGPGAMCPEPDTFELRVEGTDDRTPAGQLGALVFAAPTEAETRALTRATVVAAFENSSTVSASPISANLRFFLGVDREHNWNPWLNGGRFCIAVALMDAAGNVGERSSPLCLDTTDETAANVSFVQGSGCSVGRTTGSRGGGVALSGVLAGLVALASRRGHRRSRRTGR